MSKKLEMNGLWESSRMMLPQHKESAIRVQKDKHTFNDKYLMSKKFTLFLLYLANLKFTKELHNS